MSETLSEALSRASLQSSSMLSASQEVAGNVSTVASAAEEMSASMLARFQQRRKGMHYKTYQRLKAEFIKQDDLFDKCMTERFGDLIIDFL